MNLTEFSGFRVKPMTKKDFLRWLKDLRPYMPYLNDDGAICFGDAQEHCPITLVAKYSGLDPSIKCAAEVEEAARALGLPDSLATEIRIMADEDAPKGNPLRCAMLRSLGLKERSIERSNES